FAIVASALTVSCDRAKAFQERASEIVKTTGAFARAGMRAMIVRHVGTWPVARDQIASRFSGSAGRPSPPRAGPAGPPPPATGAGLPASLNSSALAHGYDITTPVTVRTIRIGAHHNPITLCQLKSRARPPRVERNHSTLRTVDHDHVRGSQSNGPV